MAEDVAYLALFSAQVSVVLFANDKTRSTNVILAAGWNSKIYLWEDVPEKSEVTHYRTFENGHEHDITCMAFQQPQLLATGDLGGVINIWNIYSGTTQSHLLASPFPRCMQPSFEPRT